MRNLINMRSPITRHHDKEGVEDKRKQTEQCRQKNVNSSKQDSPHALKTYAKHLITTNSKINPEASEAKPTAPAIPAAQSAASTQNKIT
jgi:hypothetical protein